MLNLILYLNLFLDWYPISFFALAILANESLTSPSLGSLYSISTGLLVKDLIVFHNCFNSNPITHSYIIYLMF